MPSAFPTRALRIGTRSSPLALAQAEELRDRLVRQAGLAADRLELVPVVASGDRVLDRPLAEIGGKALWTKELDAWLLAGEIDLAVHSLKDVETFRPPEIAIAAILPREDIRDGLVGQASIAALPAGARIGTSAPRRAAQLLNLRPDCRVVPIRGNVATRLAKLEAGDADATLLAMAGLNRLGLAHVATPLSAETWLPASGQGAIAVECRANDLELRDLLAAIDDPASRVAVFAERALLAALGGNCHSPVAVLTQLGGQTLHLRAALFSPDGTERIDGEARFAADDSTGPARLANDLLARSPSAISDHFSGG